MRGVLLGVVVGTQWTLAQGHQTKDIRTQPLYVVVVVAVREVKVAQLQV